MKRQLSAEDFDRISYQIVEGDISQHVSYSYWLSKWPELVESLGSGETLTPDDFLRQHRATSLTLDGEVIAIHLLSIFDQKDFAKTDYFKAYGEEFFDVLKANKVKRVQTLQWLMADEAFAGYGFGAAIVCLSLKHQLNGPAQASVTIARADNSVTNLAIKAGMEVVHKASMHNVPVSHMVCFEPKPYPRPEIHALVEKLWNRREYIFIEPRMELAV